MVQTMGPYPLFWYVYSPQVRWGRRGGGTEGFNVILYSDGTLVKSVYDKNFHRRERSCFQLPVEVADEFLMILQNEAWWIRGLPENIESAHGKPAYRCMFAFAGHPLFICDELKTMTQLDDVNRNGVYARRLHVMMEFITELLFNYGILLQLESFEWDWQKLAPIPENQMAPRALDLLDEDEREIVQIRNAAGM